MEENYLIPIVSVLGVLLGGWITHISTKRLQIKEVRIKLLTELWSALSDLKNYSDKLWNDVSAENLQNFVDKLDKAENEVDRKNLLIEEKEFLKLKDLFKSFKNFEDGKNNLFKVLSKVRKEDDNKTPLPFQMDSIRLEIESYIQLNHNHKEEYEYHLIELKQIFKKDIGLI